MGSLLRISVTFHEPQFHGRRGRDRETEWPPSPWRLYCALLAGSKTAAPGSWNGQAAIFRWLESLPPPVIIAPKARDGMSYMLPGRTNDADMLADKESRGVVPDELPEALRVQRIARPSILEAPTVHYLWRVRADAGDLCRRAIGEAHHLLALGWGIDQAAASGGVEEDGAVDLPGVRWWPCPEHPGRTRIPVPGALDDLEDGWRRKSDRIRDGAIDLSWHPTAYRTIHYVPDTGSLPRPYVAFLIRDRGEREGEFLSWRPTRASGLAASVRGLAAAAAVEEGLPGEWITRYVTGHVERGDNERLSYLALPTTGYRWADGRIRRVMIAEPWGGTGMHVRWLRERLAWKEIVNEQGTFAGRLVPITMGSPDIFDGVLGLYMKPSRRWASVTPVVLPGEDKHLRGKRMDLIRRCFSHAGLPNPARFRVLDGCVWEGRLVDEYKRPPYLEGFPMTHLEVEFDQPVSGPIALGSGRHCGLGILAGCDDAPLELA